MVDVALSDEDAQQLEAWMQSLGEEKHGYFARKYLREGQLETLEQQMTAKFGPLPADVTSRLQEASAAELTTWALRILTATSVTEIFEA